MRFFSNDVKWLLFHNDCLNINHNHVPYAALTSSQLRK